MLSEFALPTPNDPDFVVVMLFEYDAFPPAPIVDSYAGLHLNGVQLRCEPPPSHCEGRHSV
jgi:hypothetical protein